MQAARELLSLSSQSLVELHSLATSRLPVVKGASGNTNTQHLFQAQGLGTKLNHVAMTRLWATSFVFDREGHVATLSAGNGHPLGFLTTRQMKLDHVSNAREAQSKRAKGQIPSNENPVLFFALALMNPVMKQRPLGREAIVAPHALQVDKRALALAEGQMLQGRDGQRVLLHVCQSGIHHSTRTLVVTLAGTRSLSNVIS